MNTTHKLMLNKVGAKHLATKAAWTETERQDQQIERLSTALSEIFRVVELSPDSERGQLDQVRQTALDALGEKPGRTRIHSRAGGIGADWDLDTVLAFIDDADEVGFGMSLLGHEMYVLQGERQVNFEVAAPRTDEAVAEVEAIGG